MTSTSDSHLQDAKMVTSLAKSRILVNGGSLGRCFTIILNWVGLSSLGTTYSMAMNWEVWLPTLTQSDLPVKNSRSQARIVQDKS